MDKEYIMPTEITGEIRNKNNFPTYVDYNGEKIRLSPKQKQSGVIKSKLGVLPQGVSFVPYNVN